MRKAALLSLALIGALASAPVLANGRGHGGRVHFGVFIGAPLWYYPHYYYPPPYYYGPPFVVQSSPPVYVQQPAAPAAHDPAQQGWWYYCEQARGYYPYVKSCPGGWQKVPPAPPPAGG